MKEEAPGGAPLWMPLYVADWLADTGHLDGPEQGAYFLLTMHLWRTRAPLRDDDARLARIARTTPEAWEAMRDTIAALFVVSGGFWTHKRVGLELERAQKRRTDATAAANARHRRKGKAPKTKKEGSTRADATALRPHGDRNATALPSQCQQQPQPQEQPEAQKPKQGKKPRSESDSDSLLAAGAARGQENGHALTPQQASVQDVFDLFDRFQADRPDGGRVAAWLKLYTENHPRLLRELVRMGPWKLRKGPDYVGKVLRSVWLAPEGLEGSEEQLRAQAHDAIDILERLGGDPMTVHAWRNQVMQARGSPELRKMLPRIREYIDAHQRAHDQRENDHGRPDANPEGD